MKAIVLTDYGAPDVLQWTEVQMPQPADTEIRVRIRAAGVGPTDVALRAGALKEAIPLPPRAVLGFEAAGTVDAVGASVRGIEPGDAVAALLPHLGGYAQYATSPVWTPKPVSVSWVDAAALPASAEAAVGVLRQVGVTTGETLLVLGAGGSVGIIVTQLAVAQGVRVIAAAADRDQDLMHDLGATAITYGGDLLRKVRDHVSSVDAVIDAAGKGGLPQAVELARGSARVVTLSDTSGAAIGVSLSEPGPDRAPGALDEVMPLFAEGRLRLRDRRTLPLRRAAEAHELLESAQTHDKLILLVDP